MPKIGEFARKRKFYWKSTIPNFWSRVDKNGPIHSVYGQCWIWTGKLSRWGYGEHRLSWEIHHEGTRIPVGLCVLHKCDNPLCVNPGHLFLGTRADNNRDRDAKGRGSAAFGEANGKAKLTPELVKYIRKTYKRGSRKFGGPALAKELSVTQITISRIIRGIRWNHVN